MSKFVNLYHKEKQRIKWMVQRKHLMKYCHFSPDINKITYVSEKRILIVTPHPDDEFIGCLSIIKKYGEGVDILYAGYTGNELSKENKKMRTAELQSLCNTYGCNLLTTDEDFEKYTYSCLDRTEYDMIFIPSFIDWHIEHRMVCKVMLERLTDRHYQGDVYLYFVTVPIPYNLVTNYLPSQESKWDEFKDIYPSQCYMPLLRFKLLESTYRIKGKAIEPYYKLQSICRANDYMKEHDMNNMNAMFNKINDLCLIMESSELYYNTFTKELKN